MLATSLLSLGLLALAGWLLDTHRRDWLADRDRDLDERSRRFAVARVRRRSVATATIALVGVLIALWPVTPRRPVWVVVYMATLGSLAGLIFLLGVSDAWASSKHYRATSRREMAKHAEALAKAAQEQRAAKRPPEAEGSQG